MTKRTAFLVAVVVGSVGLSPNAAAEKFEKLSGAQIRAAKTTAENAGCCKPSIRTRAREGAEPPVKRTRSSKSGSEIPVAKSHGKYQTSGGDAATRKIESQSWIPEW